MRQALQIKQKAFTLLETTISLGIVCSLMIISIYNLKDYQARVEEHQALEWFKDSFKSAFDYSYLHGVATNLTITPNSIEFVANQKTASKKEYYFHKFQTLPKTLQAENSKITYTIFKSGQAAPITIKFDSKLTHRQYVYKVQMGWGEIIEQ